MLNTILSHSKAISSSKIQQIGFKIVLFFNFRLNCIFYFFLKALFLLNLNLIQYWTLEYGKSVCQVTTWWCYNLMEGVRPTWNILVSTALQSLLELCFQGIRILFGATKRRPSYWPDCTCSMSQLANGGLWELRGNMLDYSSLLFCCIQKEIFYRLCGDFSGELIAEYTNRDWKLERGLTYHTISHFATASKRGKGTKSYRCISWQLFLPLAEFFSDSFQHLARFYTHPHAHHRVSPPPWEGTTSCGIPCFRRCVSFKAKQEIPVSHSTIIKQEAANRFFPPRFSYSMCTFVIGRKWKLSGKCDVIACLESSFRPYFINGEALWPNILYSKYTVFVPWVIMIVTQDLVQSWL